VSTSPPPLPQTPSQWEGSLRGVWLLAVAFVLVLVGLYRFGVPALADSAARRIPSAVTEAVSAGTLSAMDRTVFEESKLPAERQGRLTRKFGLLRTPGGRASSYRLQFRKSDQLGPNAMALPSGTIVVTDALVELTSEDDEILGVLAHEAGHVDERHGMRLLLQNSLLAFGMAFLLGDTSILLGRAPQALMEAKYSRDLERAADAYAVQVLDLNDIPRRHLARMLQRLDDYGSRRGGGNGVLAYLSSHPITRERIDRVGRNP
jgi:Zn-dependent protease with chaperone function